MPTPRPPLRPFEAAAARRKVVAGEAVMQTRGLGRGAARYAVGSGWRSRDESIAGREQIRAFSARQWEREFDCALRKDRWTFGPDRIASRSQHEWLDGGGIPLR